MKRLIYQVYILQKSKMYDFCTESVAKYCKAHGIDHIVQREPILKIAPDMKRTNRNKNGIIKCGYLPIFEKENAFTYLGEYDQVAIVDADIFIRENAPNIFDELPSDYDFGGVLERDLPLTPRHKSKIVGYSRDMFQPLKDVDWEWNDSGAAFMNMGMMVMNKSIQKYFNGQSPKEFISRPEFKDFVDGIGRYKFSTDQVLLNYWLKKEKIRVKYMDWKWNALYRGAKDDQIKKAHFVHFFLKNQIPHKGENVQELKKIVS